MLERKSLCEQAYRLLAERIIGGRYPAGARLTEEALATEFGISRTPLREALRRLTAEGLIEPLPKRGLRVVAPTPEEVAELFDCRSRIEPQLLREALPRIPTSELRELRKRIETGGPEESLAVDEAMHRLIAEHCGNRFFREIALNPIRNAVDFRTVGGSYALHDKSIHQNQVLELPDNKVLVSYGQHPVCQALMIFDLDFLYADGRREDFRSGLEAWSVHQYFKGHIGGFRWAGHCAWNRRAGARLMPSPDNSPRESLLIGCHPDPDLYSSREGAVWNFPAAADGEISLDMTLRSGTKGRQAALCDRWINPSDPLAGYYAGFVLRIDGDGRIGETPAFAPGQTGTLHLTFSLAEKKLIWKAPLGSASVPLTGKITGQLSYLHLQSPAEEADYAGVMIDSVEMRKGKPGTPC